MLAAVKKETRQKTKRNEGKFNYSLSEMKKALSSKTHRVPAIKDVDDLESWLNS